MAATLHTSNRTPILPSAGQTCQPISALIGHDSLVKAAETHINSGSSDKENSQTRDTEIHREILDKLKHDSPVMLQEQWLQQYHKFKNAQTLPDSPFMMSQAVDLLRRETLLSLQSRAKIDYFSSFSHMQDPSMVASGQGMNSPSRRSQSPDDCDDGVEMLSPNPAPNNVSQWTYEEQFKQLYELGDEPDRKQFLDELFVFMQKRGTPVNRIPIMAKQTLDMYKLFKLVVGKGGLVEVINKKLWREITKGLNLPSSITSAAFTLRTQYMKYIYPYECEKYHFSNAHDLQMAIDGNKREGRRPGYGYDMQSPNTIPPFYGQQPFTGANPFFNSLMSNPVASLLSGQFNGVYMGQGQMNGLLPPTHPRLPTSLNSASSSADERTPSPINVSSPVSSENIGTRTPSPDESEPNSHKRRKAHSPGDGTPKRPNTSESTETKYKTTIERPKPVNASQKEQRDPETQARPTLSTGNIQITSHESSTINKESDQSVTVKMEVNGVLYQGVLYARRKDVCS